MPDRTLREALTEQRLRAGYSKRRSHGIHVDESDDCREYVVGECFIEAALAATPPAADTPTLDLSAIEREWIDATPPAGHPLIHGIFQRLPGQIAARLSKSPEPR